MFEQYKKSFNKILKNLNIFKHLFRVNPENNWILLVVVFVVLNVFLLGHGVLKLYYISSDELLITTDNLSNTRTETISRSLLNETLLEFRIKNENYNYLKLNKPNFVDPSI